MFLLLQGDIFVLCNVCPLPMGESPTSKLDVSLYVLSFVNVEKKQTSFNYTIQLTTGYQLRIFSVLTGNIDFHMVCFCTALGYRLN